MRIFVSYTTRDQYINVASLTILADFLKKYGDPFIDLIHNDSNEKQARVKKELCRADTVFLLLSESTKLSNWVSWEIKQARKRKIPICTITIKQDMDLSNLEIAIHNVLALSKDELTIHSPDKRITEF